MTLENLDNGSIISGKNLEYHINKTTLLGEVYLDSKLVFQADDVKGRQQLELLFHQTWAPTWHQGETIYIKNAKL
jgi:hypothetical protein